MMGPPIYYDVYVPSDMAIGDVFHDCMWSGMCAHCQESDLQHGATTVMVKPMNPRPIEQEQAYKQEMYNYVTAAATLPEDTKPIVQLASQAQRQPREIPTKFSTIGNIARPRLLASTNSGEPTGVSAVTSNRTTVVKLPAGGNTTGDHSPSAQAQPVGLGAGNSNSNGNGNSAQPSAAKQRDDHSLAAKKLRHREVEKNRHRQLQAMVRTLSERIPGRVEKETQVQTMKRAARYCVFLRDVLAAMAHGKLSCDKMEKIYLRSCDSVELIMSQQC